MRPFEAEGIEVIFPLYMKEIVAQITHQARRSPDISQRSGVSVRMTVSNGENVLSNAVRRAIRLKERQAAPRVSDLSAVLASTSGKIELDSVGDLREEKVVDKLVRQAINAVFRQYFDVSEFDQLVAGFEKGLNVQVSATQPAMEYVTQLSRVGGLRDAVDKVKGHGNPATAAAAVEFILEGLHLNKRLNKDEVAGQTRYRR
jgi:magnesium chelatase subunit I